MKKKTDHVVKRKTLTQPDVAADKQVLKRSKGGGNFAKERLALIGFNPDEIKIIETGNLKAIGKMFVEQRIREVDNIVIPEELKNEHGPLQHSQREIL